MAGTFGYELNLGLLSGEEKEEVKEQVKKFKQYAPLIQRGDYYRLSSPQKDEFGAWAFVSEDQSEALISIVMLKQHGNMTVNYVNVRTDSGCILSDRRTRPDLQRSRIDAGRTSCAD